MKKYIIFNNLFFVGLFCLLTAANASAQGGDALHHSRPKNRGLACNRPLSMYAFNNEYELFLRTTGFDRDREIRRYVRMNCLHTEQLRHLAMLYPNDREKSEFFNFVVREGNVFNTRFLYRLGSVFGSRAAQEAFYRFLSRENLPIGRETFDDYDGDYYERERDDNPRRNQGRDEDRHDRRRDEDRRGANNGMNERDFSTALASIRQESLDSRRLDKSRVILRDNVRMTTRQIAEISKSFSFDNNRLEFAKYAYDYALDRENYYQVADEMQYDSNKRTLLNYIQSRK